MVEWKKVVLVMVAMMAWCATCDIAQDREKCADQLVGLATCLPYVSSESKAPPKDCCTGFNQVVKESIECVCLLIKDRNDPSLGLTINATRALSLPDICHTPTNESVSDCPSILHLTPNSPDAKVFEDFAKSAGNKSNGTTTAAGSSSSGSTSASATADPKKSNGDGGGKKRWLEEARIVTGVLIVVAALHIFTITNIV